MPFVIGGCWHVPSSLVHREPGPVVQRWRSEMKWPLSSATPWRRMESTAVHFIEFPLLMSGLWTPVWRPSITRVRGHRGGSSRCSFFTIIWKTKVWPVCHVIASTWKMMTVNHKVWLFVWSCSDWPHTTRTRAPSCWWALVFFFSPVCARFAGRPTATRSRGGWAAVLWFSNDEQKCVNATSRFRDHLTSAAQPSCDQWPGESANVRLINNGENIPSLQLTRSSISAVLRAKRRGGH